MDARAHGKSDKPRDKNAYGLETALDIIRLMDHLELDKVHLVGSSFGVRIGTTILSRYPERFKTATLIGGRPQWDWTEEKQTSVEKQAEGFINNPRPYTIERGLDPTALAYLRLSFPELIVESAEKFKALEIPFLLVYGSEEWIHLNGLDKELQEMLINARLFIIDGAKHGETYPRPEFLTTLKEFLKEN
jgi:pimeloyl-ACP methyl ester carboxylesterase